MSEISLSIILEIGLGLEEYGINDNSQSPYYNPKIPYGASSTPLSNGFGYSQENPENPNIPKNPGSVPDPQDSSSQNLSSTTTPVGYQRKLTKHQ